MTDTNASDIYLSSGERLMEHYNALVKSVNNFIYPERSSLISGLPDPSNWSGKKKLWFQFFMPLALLDDSYFELKDAGKRGLIVFGWIMLFWYWIIFSIITMQLTFEYAPLGVTPQPVTINQYAWKAFLTFFLLAMTGILPYMQMGWFLFNRKIPFLDRVFWTFGFIMVVILEFQTIVEQVSRPLYEILSYGRAKFMFYYGIISFLFPLGIVITFIIFLIIKNIIFTGISWLNNFARSHLSTSFSAIQKFALGTIEEGEDSWRLASLQASEIKSIKEWAQNNLDATEKKLIPATIFLTFLGILFAVSPREKGLVEIILSSSSYVRYGFGPSSSESQKFAAILLAIFLFITIGTSIVLVLVVAFIAYTRLFRNLIVQGVVVEICTVAEYAKSELETNLAKNKKNSLWKTILDWLFNIISRTR